MITKILKITFPTTLILIILFIGYSSYKKVTKNTENPLNIIPTNAAVILQCNAPDKLYSTLNSTNKSFFAKSWKPVAQYKKQIFPNFLWLSITLLRHSRAKESQGKSKKEMRRMRRK